MGRSLFKHSRGWLHPTDGSPARYWHRPLRVVQKLPSCRVLEINQPTNTEDIMNLHEQEEIEFGNGPRLWDADPNVCCAAFQLGACVHTEQYDEYTNEFVPVATSATPYGRPVYGI